MVNEGSNNIESSKDRNKKTICNIQFIVNEILTTLKLRPKQLAKEMLPNNLLDYLIYKIKQYKEYTHKVISSEEEKVVINLIATGINEKNIDILIENTKKMVGDTRSFHIFDMSIVHSIGLENIDILQKKGYSYKQIISIAKVILYDSSAISTIITAKEVLPIKFYTEFLIKIDTLFEEKATLSWAIQFRKYHIFESGTEDQEYEYIKNMLENNIFIIFNNYISFLKKEGKKITSFLTEDEFRNHIYQQYIYTEVENTKSKNHNTLTVSEIRKYVEKKQKIGESSYTLSKDDYKNLFENSFLMQGIIKNCTLVSYIDLLSDKNFFEVIIRTSVKVNKDKYHIKMPLGSIGGKRIEINKYEIDQWNGINNKQFFSYVRKQMGNPESLNQKEHIQEYKIGNTLLEIAYCKSSARHNETLEEIEKRIDGNNIFLNRFIDISNVSRESIESSSLEVEKIKKIISSISRISQGNTFISVHVNFKKKLTLKHEKESIILHNKHTYSFKKVYIKDKEVICEVTNPRDTKYPIKFTLEELLLTMDYFQVYTLDINKIFS